VSWVPWAAILVRHSIAALIRVFYGPEELYHTAIERMREHGKASPGAARRESDDLRVLEVVMALGQQSSYRIGKSAGIHSGRVACALARLENAGRIRAFWEADPRDRPRRRLYEVVK
jgi:hypothetical protein